MGKAIVTMKIMPDSPDVDLEAVEVKAKEEITKFAGTGDTKTEIEPIAFGLKALKITFIMDENQGSPDALEEHIVALEGVNSFEIVDVRRALG